MALDKGRILFQSDTCSVSSVLSMAPEIEWALKNKWSNGQAMSAHEIPCMAHGWYYPEKQWAPYEAVIPT